MIHRALAAARLSVTLPPESKRSLTENFCPFDSTSFERPRHAMRRRGRRS